MTDLYQLAAGVGVERRESGSKPLHAAGVALGRTRKTAHKLERLGEVVVGDLVHQRADRLGNQLHAKLFDVEEGIEPDRDVRAAIVFLDRSRSQQQHTVSIDFLLERLALLEAVSLQAASI